MQHLKPTFLFPQIEKLIIFKVNPFTDERGEFTRVYCEQEFEQYDFQVKQINICKNPNQYTLRGLHYQIGFNQKKIIKCLKGSIQDVVVDVRSYSKTFGKYATFWLRESMDEYLMVPSGCAHGFLTLKPNTEVMYFSSEAYDPYKEKGIRYNDPKFDIDWVNDPIIISKKDSEIPFWED